MAGTVDSQEILVAHNTYRNAVGSPDLQWSDTLAQSAQQWADHLASIHTFQHSGTPGVGENIVLGAKGGYSLTQLVGLWGQEKADFKPGIFPDVAIDGNWQNVGHYTQVIWGTTTQVGCGFASDDVSDYLVCQYTPQGNVFGQNVLPITPSQFTSVYAQGDPGNGIGGYDLKSAADQAFAFDYDSSGKLDHLVFYRPGTGTIWILKNNAGQFTSVYTSGTGIGGYDLKSAVDQAFAFDYDNSGKLDHLVFYRPGTGTIWILKNSAGQFSPVYTSGTGIGGYDLKSATDRAFAFDYDGSGKLDHLAFYRPGTGTIWILKK